MGVGYLARDGSRHNNIADLNAANARYDQQQRQNKLLEEQNKLLEETKKQQEYQIREMKRKEREEKNSYLTSINYSSYNNIYTQSDEEIREWDREDRIEKYGKLSIKQLQTRVDKKKQELEKISRKLKIAKLADKAEENREKRIYIVLFILLIAFCSLFATNFSSIKIFVGLLIVLPIINSIITGIAKLKINKKLEGQEDLEDLPDTSVDLKDLKKETKEEIEDLEEIIIGKRDDINNDEIKRNLKKSNGETLYKKKNKRTKNKDNKIEDILKIEE